MTSLQINTHTHTILDRYLLSVFTNKDENYVLVFQVSTVHYLHTMVQKHTPTVQLQGSWHVLLITQDPAASVLLAPQWWNGLPASPQTA